MAGGAPPVAAAILVATYFARQPCAPGTKCVEMVFIAVWTEAVFLDNKFATENRTALTRKMKKGVLMTASLIKCSFLCQDCATARHETDGSAVEVGSASLWPKCAIAPLTAQTEATKCVMQSTVTKFDQFPAKVHSAYPGKRLTGAPMQGFAMVTRRNMPPVEEPRMSVS
jgi:hypothetical protein